MSVWKDDLQMSNDWGVNEGLLLYVIFWQPPTSVTLQVPAPCLWLHSPLLTSLHDLLHMTQVRCYLLKERSPDSLSGAGHLICTHLHSVCAVGLDLSSHDCNHCSFVSLSSINCKILERQDNTGSLKVQCLSRSGCRITVHSSITQEPHPIISFPFNDMKDLKSTAGQVLGSGSSVNPVADGSLIFMTLVSEDIFPSPFPSSVST